MILIDVAFHSRRDDLRTANIIADDPEGVSCLVIDRETFNQLISSLDEIRTRYKDELVERRRYECILPRDILDDRLMAGYRLISHAVSCFVCSSLMS